MRALAVVMLLIGCTGSTAPTTTPPPVTAATCVTDDDCIVSCATKGQCCNNPFCETAQARADVLAALTYNDAHPCAQAEIDKCPQVGGRLEPSYTITPRCKSGACVAEHTPRVAATPQVVNTSAYDLACKVDSDCAVVKAAVCEVCACPTTPITARDSARFKREADAIVCSEPDHGIQCGDCADLRPACRAGTCIAR